MPIRVGGLKVESGDWLLGDDDGVTVAEALERIGYAGSAPLGARAFDAYLELHIEQAPVLAIFEQPRHPYTAALIKAVGKLGGERQRYLEALPGAVPSLNSATSLTSGRASPAGITGASPSVQAIEPTLNIAGDSAGMK